MARTVKRRRPKAEKKPSLPPKDYRADGEKAAFLIALIAGCAPFVLLAVLMWFRLRESVWQMAAIPLLWLAISPSVAARQVGGGLPVRLRREGARTKAAQAAYPRTLNFISQSAKLLGIPVPDLHIVPGMARTSLALGGERRRRRPPSILVSERIASALTEVELCAVAGRELGHIAARHAKWYAIALALSERGAKTKLVALPLLPVALLLRPWMQLTERTADNLAILLVGSSAPVNAAIVKLAVTGDELKQIDPGELDAYLASDTDLALDSQEMERYFRIGTFVAGTPGLQERIKAVSRYLRTEKGKAAAAKLEEVRRAA